MDLRDDYQCGERRYTCRLRKLSRRMLPGNRCYLLTIVFLVRTIADAGFQPCEQNRSKTKKEANWHCANTPEFIHKTRLICFRRNVCKGEFLKFFRSRRPH